MSCPWILTGLRKVFLALGVAPPEIPLSSNDREFPTRMILVLVLLDVLTKYQLDILTLKAFLGDYKVRDGVVGVGK